MSEQKVDIFGQIEEALSLAEKLNPQAFPIFASTVAIASGVQFLMLVFPEQEGTIGFLKTTGEVLFSVFPHMGGDVNVPPKVLVVDDGSVFDSSAASQQFFFNVNKVLCKRYLEVDFFGREVWFDRSWRMYKVASMVLDEAAFIWIFGKINGLAVAFGFWTNQSWRRKDEDRAIIARAAWGSFVDKLGISWEKLNNGEQEIVIQEGGKYSEDIESIFRKTFAVT